MRQLLQKLWQSLGKETQTISYSHLIDFSIARELSLHNSLSGIALGGFKCAILPTARNPLTGYPPAPRR
jgi:hypothetical protein